jgi:hypothetical protein
MPRMRVIELGIGSCQIRLSFWECSPPIARPKADILMYTTYVDHKAQEADKVPSKYTRRILSQFFPE